MMSAKIVMWKTMTMMQKKTPRMMWKRTTRKVMLAKQMKMTLSEVYSAQCARRSLNAPINMTT